MFLPYNFKLIIMRAQNSPSFFPFKETTLFCVSKILHSIPLTIHEQSIQVSLLLYHWSRMPILLIHGIFFWGEKYFLSLFNFQSPHLLLSRQSWLQNKQPRLLQTTAPDSNFYTKLFHKHLKTKTKVLPSLSHYANQHPELQRRFNKTFQGKTTELWSHVTSDFFKN